MQWCELCEANSGRVNALRECCRARDLANGPFDRRDEALKRIEIREGREARDELHTNILKFMARKLARAPKSVRTLAYMTEAGAYMIEWSEKLKQFTKEEYDRIAAQSA